MTVYYVLNQLGPHSKGDVLSFSPEQIGAGVDISHLTSVGAIRVATPLLDPPSAPTLATAGSGGTVLAGVYTVKISYVTAVGETTPSSSTTITTSGTTSTLTVTSPAPATGATGWYASISQVNGSSLTRQQTAPTPIGTSLVLTAPPTASGPAPLGTNTSGEAARAVPAQIQATHAPQGVGVFTNNGVPDGTSYAGIAAYGSLCWNVAVSPPAIYVNTGTIAAPVWTASGGIPGLTSDGGTPGGVVIAGQMTVGSPDLDASHEFHTIHGSLSVFDAVGTEANDDDVILGRQGQPLTGNYSAAVLTLFRGGELNGFDYTYPMVQVDDSTDSTAPLARFTKKLIPSFQVDGDGIQVHDKFKTGASIAHTLGAYSGNAVPIYDEAGTLLGYMPLYA